MVNPYDLLRRARTRLRLGVAGDRHLASDICHREFLQMSKKDTLRWAMKRTLFKRRQGIVSLLVRMRLVERDPNGDNVLA
jgi:hypothetical protein